MKTLIGTETETETAGRFWVHAGPERFEVRVTSSLYDDDGAEVGSGIDGDAFAIWINGGVPQMAWHREVLRQMYQIHSDLFGVPQTPAMEQKRRELVFMQFKRDLNRQGGGDALLGLSVRR